jgi:hypothetical protein
MSQFYISSVPPEPDLLRCYVSQRTRQTITITGVTEDGAIQDFTGVVQSVERNDAEAPRRRWRITLE